MRGTVLHYRIIEELGAGGMGQVFKAEDLKLGRTVALKFLSENLARDHEALKRFAIEARAASSLNHPHICTIHQIEEFEGKPFIVMELLEGQPLSSLIHEAPLDLPELVEFGIQIAGALQSAHEKGIVHRDIKPSNIFVLDRRAVKILDFGLAKLTPKPSRASGGDAATQTELTLTLDRSLVETGLPVGTIGYLSPEQIKGEPADARADLFSFGITLYEMATGRAPFRGSSAAVVLGAILHEIPASPSSQNPQLPRGFDRIVAKALEKDKSARYQTANELRRDLAGLQQQLATGPKPSRKNLLPWILTATLILFSCLALFLVRLHLTSPRATPPAQTAAHAHRRSLAVFSFKNLTGRRDTDWLSVAFSEMLATELAAGEQLRIIPGENVTRANLGSSLTDAGSFNESTLARLHERLGTDLVVAGSYIDLGADAGNQLRVDVRLQDTALGETLLAVSKTGTESHLFQLVAQVSSELRAKLGAGDVQSAEAEGVRASLPASPETMRLYAEGLEALRVFDFLAARDKLRAVTSAQPDYAPGHAALSRAYASLGYDDSARQEAKRAYDLAAGLSREDRLAIEALYRRTTHERDRAIRICQSLWKSFPDNVEYGLQLASAQTLGGKGRDALETVSALRALPNAARRDPRIDLAEAIALESLSEFEPMLKVLQNLFTRNEASPLVLARAYAQQGWAFYRTGSVPQALAALQRARKLYGDSGQKQGSANVTRTTGDILYSSGKFEQARQLYEQALATYREIGDQFGTANALTGIANAFYTNGQSSEAKPLYQQALDINRSVGSMAATAGALGNLANVLDDEGDLEGASKMQEQSLAAFRQAGDRRGASSTLSNIGNLLLEKGDLAAARQAQEQAVAEKRQIKTRSGLGYALQGLGEVLVAQGDLVNARRAFDETAAIRRDLGEQQALAKTWLDLADLSIKEAQPEAGEKLARAALAEFQKTKDGESEAVAGAIVSRALLRQGKLPEAGHSAETARSALPANATYPSRFLVGTTAASARGMSGKFREAMAELQNVIATAKSRGYLGSEFEARLALAEVQQKAGDSAAAEAGLHDLEQDARLKGFQFLASKARDPR